MDIAGMRKTAKQELLDMGIDLRDVDQPIGTCRAASASAWPSPGPSISGPRC